jgi:replicative DNA helicase
MDSPQKDLIGVSSGLENLDNITLGFQKEKLYIIAARPAMGKTMFALNLARNAALQGIPTAFLSIEMGSSQLINRLLTIETGIEGNRILQNRLSYDERATMKETTANLAKSPLYIDDSAKLTLSDLKTKAKRIKREKGVEIMFIDYLQLIKGSSNFKNRETEISEISNGLKELSKSLKLPIISLAQLSREAEKSKDKRPSLAHLRESGAIEQDADVVMFLYRPEYYGIKQDANGASTINLTQVSIAKHRDGAVGEIELFCDLKFGKYSTFDAPIANSPNFTSNLIPISQAKDDKPPF